MEIDNADREFAKQLFAVNRVETPQTLTEDEREEREFARQLFGNNNKGEQE